LIWKCESINRSNRIRGLRRIRRCGATWRAKSRPYSHRRTRKASNEWKKAISPIWWSRRRSITSSSAIATWRRLAVFSIRKATASARRKVSYSFYCYCYCCCIIALLTLNNQRIQLNRNIVGSPWRDRISLAILELQEKGSIHLLYNKWWKDTGDVCNRDDKNKESKASALGVENIGQ